MRKAELSLFVVGFGRVGSALASQGRAAGVELVGIETRDGLRQRRARRLLGRPNRDLDSAALVALAVPDSAVEAVAAALRPRLSAKQLVFHLSGTLGLEVLQSAQSAGTRVGSLHPYCSVASAESPLSGAACAIEGGPRERSRLKRLAAHLGMRPFRSPPSNRVAYHLSAVLTVASAGAAALVGTSLLQQGGASGPEARQALAALLRSVAFNLERQPPAAALTGPFARGDLERIRLQLAVLRNDPLASQLYRGVGQLTAAASPQLTEEQRAAVRDLLR